MTLSGLPYPWENHGHRCGLDCCVAPRIAHIGSLKAQYAREARPEAERQFDELLASGKIENRTPHFREGHVRLLANSIAVDRLLQPASEKKARAA
jgi:hypothetical protein